MSTKTQESRSARCLNPLIIEESIKFWSDRAVCLGSLGLNPLIIEESIKLLVFD